MEEEGCKSKPSQASAFDLSDHNVAAGLIAFYTGYNGKPEYLTDFSQASTVESFDLCHMFLYYSIALRPIR